MALSHILLVCGFIHINHADTYYVDEGGTDEENCGTKEQPCRSVSFLVPRPILSADTIQLSGTIKDEKILFKDLDPITITGLAMDSATLEGIYPKYEENICVQCDNSSLTIRTLTLTETPESDDSDYNHTVLLKVIQDSVVLISNCRVIGRDHQNHYFSWIACHNGSTLDIQDTTFSNIKMKEGSVIDMHSNTSFTMSNSKVTGLVVEDIFGGFLWSRLTDQKKVIIDNTTFSNIKLSGYGGAAIAVNMSDGTSVQIGTNSAVEFVDCVTTNDIYGDSSIGGAIYLDLEEDFTPNLKIGPKVNFTRCNADFGKNIFINAKNLKKTVTTETLDFTIQVDEFLEYCGYASGSENTSTVAIPLLLYRRPHVNELYISSGENAKDHEQCGWEDYPCRSIHYAMSKVYDDYDYIFLGSGVSMTQAWFLGEGSYIITCPKGQASTELTVKSDRSDTLQAAITINADVDFRAVKFTIPEKLDHNVFLRAFGDRLSFQDCTFNFPSNDQHNYVLFESIECECTFDTLILSNAPFENDVIRLNNSKHVTLSNFKLDNISCKAGCIINTYTDKETDYKLVIKDSVFSHTINTDNSETGIVIRARDYNITMTNVSFIGRAPVPDPTAMSNEFFDISQNDDDDELCRWTSSLVHLEGCDTTMVDTIFTRAKVGGLSIKGGSLNIESGYFRENHAGSRKFRNARRNVHCEGKAQVVIKSLLGGDGTREHPSPWMDFGDCTVKSDLISADAALFYPTLTNITYEKKDGNYRLRFTGKYLIPCNVSAEIFEYEKGVEKDRKQLKFTDFTNERFAYVTIPVKELNVKKQFYGRLKYGRTGGDFSAAVMVTHPAKGKGGLVVLTVFMVILFIGLVVGAAVFIYWFGFKHRPRQGYVNIDKQAPANNSDSNL
ncbi:hypothetical protein BLNAU_2250 [Blattamonas nauphoetae]|uniref:Right handed beta helix domain-containing protein n=1 Tax=Blattamonas nauphoetae TaxID=2049346 RepID=A0ABQ9YGD2_9EUKA|nr:hypothetical protein BLNAU_2250 [Blattamonas nauphoetae]